MTRFIQLWVFGLLCVALYGQVDTGSIQGTVKDPSGAVIPHATVTLTNEGTSQTITVTTNENGHFIATPLHIGQYTVTAQANGFQKASSPHVELNVQQQVTVDFTMSPGAVNQTVEVNAAAPPLQTDNASVGQLVNAQAVNNLPLNGRNFTFLAQISAGVTVSQQDSRGLAATGNFSANGNRPYQNNYLLDGIDNNSNLVDFLNGTMFVVRPPIDAIAEFRVQTSNYSAELGRAAGAVLNATIKSGTNQFHGDAWEFLRNDKLDAADFFVNANGGKKGEFRQNQFGFTAGGPIVKNKTFIFGDYEGTRIRQAIPQIVSVPTLAERNSGYTNFQDLIIGQSGTRNDLLGRTFPLGTVFDPATTRAVTAGQIDPVTGLTATTSGYVRDPFFQGGLAGIKNFVGLTNQLNLIPANRLDPNAIKLLNLYPTPTSSSLFSNYSTSPVKNDNVDAFDIRGDQVFSEHDTMFARFSYFNEPTVTPGPFGGIADGGAFFQGNQTVVSINAAASETHVFSPTTINELRLGYSRLHANRLQPNADTLGIPQQFGIQGIPQLPQNGGLPMLAINGLQTLGSNGFLPSDEISATSQFTENLTRILHSHNLRFGFEMQRAKITLLQPAASRGSFNFTGAYASVPNANGGNVGRAEFLLSPVASIIPNGIANVGGADSISASSFNLIDDRRNYYALYLQDDWKLTPRLTMNLGLRWEYFSPMTEAHDAQANFVPGTPFSTAQYLIPSSRKGDVLSPSFLSTVAKDGIQLIYTDNRALADWQKANFAPRIGFAYQATAKFVIRAGYGIFYGGFENRFGSRNIGNNYPFAVNVSLPSPDAAHPITPDNSVGSLESGLANVNLNSRSTNAKGINLRGLQYQFGTPYSESMNFTLQYQVARNDTFSIGYVGTLARHLMVDPGLNQITQLLPPSANPQLYVPFPDLARGGAYPQTEGNSFYHSLQTVLEHRFHNGLNFLTNYTWSKVRSDARDLQNNNVGGYRAPGIPGFGIQGDYGLADFDVRHAVHFSGGYQLPIGNGRRWLNAGRGFANQVFGGWSTQWLLTLQSGQPFTVPCSITTAAGTGCFALMVPGQSVTAGKHNVDQWMNPAAFHNPSVATAVGQPDLSPLGGAPTQLTGPPLRRLDFSMFKQFPIREQMRLEFRTEVFNLTNTPAFSIPGFSGNGVSAAPGALDFTNTINFGRITSTRDNPNDPREIQFALKFYW